MKNDTRPDYQIAQEELGLLFESIGLSAATIHNKGKHVDADSWGHTEWEVTIRRVWFGQAPRSARFEWRTGLGYEGEPDPAEVLARVCDEFHGTIDRTFEEWADDYGYDQDSRRAEKIFNACKEGEHKLAGLGLSPEQIARFAELSQRL